MGRSAAIVLALAPVVAACSALGSASLAPEAANTPERSTVASPSAQAPTSTPRQATAAPTASAVPVVTPTLAPTAVPPPVSGDFQYADILRVEVNGLAVREAPSLASRLSRAYQDVGGTPQAAGDVRLDAGYFVSVYMGPLWSGDTAWYLVWPAVDGRFNYNPGPWWDSNGDFPTAGGVDPGWVAGSVAGWQFMQRGCVSTLAASTNIARDRSAGSEIDANAEGACKPLGAGVCAEPAKGSTTAAGKRRATSATPSYQTVSPLI